MTRWDLERVLQIEICVRKPRIDDSVGRPISANTPADVAPIHERLNLDQDHWEMQIKNFGRLLANVAGKPRDVYEMRSLISSRRF